MKNLITSITFGAVALVAGVACHRLAPTLGLVLMPMFWPLALLAAKVPAKYSVTTAAMVPFAAYLISGMPAAPMIVAVKFALFTGAVALFSRKVLAKTR